MSNSYSQKRASTSATESANAPLRVSSCCWRANPITWRRSSCSATHTQAQKTRRAPWKSGRVPRTLAIAAGDATRVATLRSRIEVIDSAAAAALPAPVAPPRAAAAATMLFEAPAPAEADDAAGDAGSPDEIEIDIDAAEFGDAAEESAADEPGTFGADIEEVAGAPPSDEESAESDAAPGDVEIEIDADAFVQALAAGAADAAVDEPVAIESTSFEATEPAGETSPLDEPEIPDHFEVAQSASEAEAESFEAPAPLAVQEEPGPEAQPEPEPELEEAPELELEREAPLALELQPQAETPPAPQPGASAAPVSAAAVRSRRVLRHELGGDHRGAGGGGVLLRAGTARRSRVDLSARRAARAEPPRCAAAARRDRGGARAGCGDLGG